MASAVQKLRDEVKAGRKEGCNCPICGQYAKEYERQITSAMVKTLWLVKEWFELNDPTLDQKYVHVDEHINTLPRNRQPTTRGASGDFAKMRFWGLIAESPSIRADGSSRAGYWRITQKGVDFLMDKIKVPKTAIVFDNKLFKLTNDPVSVHDCLKKRFNYNDLMSL